MSNLSADFAARLAETASAIEEALTARLDNAQRDHEIARPARLMAAMRHGALGGGKRLRPFLLTATAGLFGVTPAAALQAATAIECVHCYSLVHDDLPSMDDDDLRRGRPTVHRAFDDATAILAGDSLLTLAFEILAEEATHADPAIRAALVLALARASGLGGMAGGQMFDLEAEGRYPESRRDGPPWPGDVRRLQAMKTGALLAAAVDMGAILGQAGLPQRMALSAYGQSLGAAFQVADDILDVESNPKRSARPPPRTPTATRPPSSSPSGSTPPARSATASPTTPSARSDASAPRPTCCARRRGSPAGGGFEGASSAHPSTPG